MCSRVTPISSSVSRSAAASRTSGESDSDDYDSEDESDYSGEDDSDVTVVTLHPNKAFIHSPTGKTRTLKGDPGQILGAR